MITGFSHVALYTPRLEQTVSFYQEVFHAKLIRAFDRPHKGCWLSLGKDILEVFESEPLGNGLFKHISIACDDVDAYYLQALSFGATPCVPPKDITQPVPARIAFIQGPSGEQIELFSPKSP